MCKIKGDDEVNAIKKRFFRLVSPLDSRSWGARLAANGQWDNVCLGTRNILLQLPSYPNETHTHTHIVPLYM